MSNFSDDISSIVIITSDVRLFPMQQQNEYKL